MASDAMDIALVFAVGGLVGIGELVSRFRDEPGRAVMSFPGALYITVNGLASIIALVALRTFGWEPAEDAAQQTRLLHILTAGLGAMAVFRSALFTVRVSGTDIGVGPVAFLQIMLAAIDRGVDRKRARERADRVIRIMHGLTFDQLVLALPAFSIALMQNLAPEDVDAIGDGVKQLNDRQMPDEAKVLNLGLVLMNYVGEGVLEESVIGLRKQLKLGPPPSSRGLSQILDRGSSVPGQPSVTGRPAARRSPKMPPGGAATTALASDSNADQPPPGATAHGTALDDVESKPTDDPKS
jgi:hypothetical protein